MWKESVGPALARAIVKTERHAHAAMTEAARFEHYSAIIRNNVLQAQTVRAPDGTGTFHGGRFWLHKNQSWHLMLRANTA